MRRFLIDTDTASDDAVAILMALRAPDIRVEAITIVAGNVSVKEGTRNALHTVQLCGAEVPVYPGVDRPLVREPSRAYFFHGEDGMGGMSLPPLRLAPEEEHAVDRIIKTIRGAPGEITLVTLGPLTNVALAVRKAPDISALVREVYVMGGAANTVGNVTPAAEFNIWCDPEAAEIVFHSGMPLMMVGWEHCLGEALLEDADREEVRAFGTPYADFTLDSNIQALKACLEWLGLTGLSLPDPVTMAIAIDRSVCTRSSRHYVDVEVHSELTRGMTVVDEYGVTNKEANVEVCWEIDPARWKEVLYGTLR